MTKRLVIIGAGGHGKVVADCALATGTFSEIVFLDGLYPEITKVAHWPVIGNTDNLSAFADPSSVFFVAIPQANPINTTKLPNYPSSIWAGSLPLFLKTLLFSSPQFSF